MKLRTILLGISALFVAGCAAYFSVLGLSKLFAGASMAVILMASSLELAKLITAGFLYNYWEHINKVLRIYLLVGTVVLIMITSAGIYGFLTSAYQTTSDQLSMLDKRVELVETKRDRYQIQYDEYSVEKASIQETITDLTKGLSNNVIQYKDKETGEIITTTSSNTRKVLTNQLNENKEQRDKISEKMEVLSDSITSLDIRALEIRATDEVAGEVGPLKYLAEITNQPMNKIVNWFALFIIFVFDPLAVTLIVAFNTALKVDSGIKDKKKAEEKRTVYGEHEEEEWDGFGHYPKTDEEVDNLNDAKKHADELWDESEESFSMSDEDFAKLLDGVENSSEPNEVLSEAYKKYVDEQLTEMEREEPKVAITNDDEDAEGLPPLYDKEETNVNDIELVEEEYIVQPDENDLPNLDIPLDTNDDGVVTPEEQRNHYETVGWKQPYQGKPFYHHPWFDWKIASRWINDTHAVEFWKKYRGGNQSQYESIVQSNYPTDFKSKTY